MAKFIKVTDLFSSKVSYFNVDHIVYVSGETGANINFVGDYFRVKETKEEVMELIRNA